MSHLTPTSSAVLGTLFLAVIILLIILLISLFTNTNPAISTNIVFLVGIVIAVTLLILAFILYVFAWLVTAFSRDCSVNEKL